MDAVEGVTLAWEAGSLRLRAIFDCAVNEFAEFLPMVSAFARLLGEQHAAEAAVEPLRLFDGS